MARAEEVLIASWRIASEQFRDAARVASEPDLKRRLAHRAIDLAQRAESFERSMQDASAEPF